MDVKMNINVICVMDGKSKITIQICLKQRNVSFITPYAKKKSSAHFTIKNELKRTLNEEEKKNIKRKLENLKLLKPINKLDNMF